MEFKFLHPFELSQFLQTGLNSSRLNDSARKFLSDFHWFLDYINRHLKIKLSKVTSSLPLVHILEIERHFADLFKPTKTSKQSYHLEVHFFMLLSKKMELIFFNDRNFLRSGQHLDKFLNFPDWYQLGLCFQNFWFEINWNEFLPLRDQDHQNKVQNNADSVIELFSYVPSGESIDFSNCIPMLNHYFHLYI